VALFIETLSDNANRTVADIRYVLGRHGGSLGTTGSVAWQFDRKGQIYVSAERYHEDAVLEAALLAGAEDVEREGDEFVVTTDVQSFHEVQDGLRAAGVDFSEAELSMIPQNEIAVEGRDAEKLMKLLDGLEELDDVQKVHSNADIDDAVLAAS
jgi:YebC/PmpR family DNA-binding regulatory protein